MRKKKSYTIIDANILIAFIDKRDVHHGRARDALLSISQTDELVVLLPVLAEAYSVIARRCKERNYDCKTALQNMKTLENLLVKVNPSIDYHHRVVDSIVDFPELNYNDWLLILYAVDRGLKVLSLDEKLNQKLFELSNRL